MRRLLSTFALLVAIAAPAAAQDFFAQRTVYFAVTDCTTNHGGSTSIVICGGSADPEGNVTGIAGRSIYFRTDGTIWMKAAGTGTDTSGWQGVTTPNVHVTSTAPYVRLTESDAGSDQKVWQWANGTGTFVLQALTDDLLTTTDVVSITRSNHDLTMASLAAGTGAVGGPSVSIGRNSSGSGAPGVLKLAQLDGDVSLLWIDSTGALHLGTSQPTEAGGDTGGSIVATADNTLTLTGKTYDAEGTGNTLTIPSAFVFNAAVCQDTTAALGFSIPASANAPTATCVTGTNVNFGVAGFDDDAVHRAQGHFRLPADWTGTIDLVGKWRTAETSGSVVWQIATACVADGETSDPSWNTAQTITDAAKGTTHQQNDFELMSVTTTGCAAGEEFYFKFFRDASDGSDDLATSVDGVAQLIQLTFTIRRAM